MTKGKGRDYFNNQITEYSIFITRITHGYVCSNCENHFRYSAPDKNMTRSKSGQCFVHWRMYTCSGGDNAFLTESPSLVLVEALMPVKTLGVSVSGRGEFIGEAPGVVTSGGDVASRLDDDCVVFWACESRRTRRYG